MPVEVVDEMRDRELGARWAKRAATQMLRALGLAEHELCVVLTTDERIRALNRDHRGFDKPTDVLAFAARESPVARFHPTVLGDLVLSIPTTRRQAVAHATSPRREATMLLAHGLLHLLGFDHRDRAEERRMKARTDLLMSAAGPLEDANPGSASLSRGRNSRLGSR